MPSTNARTARVTTSFRPSRDALAGTETSLKITN